MLVCSECRETQREGAGVCLSCGHRFPPGTDEVAEPRKVTRPRGSLTRSIVSASLLVVVGCLWLLRPEPTDPVQPALERLTQQVEFNVRQAGTIDPAVQQELIVAAQAASGCGKIDVYPIPASAVAAPSGGMAPSTTSPEATLTAYFETLHVDGLAILEAGQVYVVAAAWGCS